MADVRTIARDLVESCRRRNDEWEQRTGRPSSIAEAEYEAAERELVAVLSKYVTPVRRADLAPGDPRHGTNGYSNLGCRCEACKEAWRRYKADYRDRNPHRDRATGLVIRKGATSL